MAFLEIQNCRIKGFAAAVPKNVEDNSSLQLLGNAEDIQKFLDLTGIYKRHTVADSGICTSDLCLAAAEKLIRDLNWQNDEIDCLIFVSQTPDYILPATSCILQSKLGLSDSCYALDISLGCSGWVYGLSTITSLVSAGRFRKALLLAGDTVTVTKSPADKSTYPLFGDAGTATAICFDETATPLFFHTGTDGSGFDSIIIRDGGFRHFFSDESLKVETKEDGVIRNNLHSSLNGTNVFVFGISRAPQSIRQLLTHFNIDLDQINYFVLHQANKMMTEKIRKKIGIDPEKLPYSISEFGNTSSASIPLTIVSQLGSKLGTERSKVVACGFGVGLSWATCLMDLDHIHCCELIYL